MPTLQETTFHHGEQDRVRVPKLRRLLEHLIDAEVITTSDAVAALADLVLTGNSGKVITINAGGVGFDLVSPTYVTDGDKGHVIVSGGGATWLFDPSVVTAFALTLLDDADAASARTTLGAEPTIAAGSAGQYWRHDKTWAALNIAAVSGLTSALSDKLDDTQASAFGLTLIDDADATTARATLGLIIGTDVQAQDAQLAAIAGLTPAADQVIYWTSATAAAMMDFSSVARTLVAQTTQSAMRSTGLGLGSAAVENIGTSGSNVPKLDGANTWGASQIVSVASSATVAHIGLAGGATHAWINFGAAGFAAPSFTTRSQGVKLCLYQALSGSAVDYAIGIESGALWLAASVNTQAIKFYGGTTLFGSITSAGLLVGTTQVVGTRKTGWGTMTGTATRTAFDTASVTLPQLAERVKALIDDLRSHGLINN